MEPDTRRRPVFRSFLYVPGHQPERIERAYASQADAVILDLEDAVPVWEKDRAREIVAGYTAKPTVKPTYVRVNGIGTGRCLDDVAAVVGSGLEGVRMAKVGHPDDVRRVASALERAGSSATIHLLIESARALENVYGLAIAARAVSMLGLGESDLRADLRTGLEGPTMDASRARVVIASRAAGLPSPCQSVWPEPRDPEGLLRSCLHGKNLGFVGRMAIHPAQLPIIHDVYTPTTGEIKDAQEICEAAELAHENNASVVITAKGRLVAPPIIANARQTLSLANALNLVTEAS
ncbi:HpcH/HpaI aldolase/citrate lyase family protein [Kitasatospora sp. NPDC086801]|uniref:HpcH/HpaI aldolase/citrate lyase family protein n=1 Tax=Kitasatospora sp. NPDC086801 TaxID=3364066 RepID=UPI00380B5EA8